MLSHLVVAWDRFNCISLLCGVDPLWWYRNFLRCHHLGEHWCQLPETQPKEPLKINISLNLHFCMLKTILYTRAFKTSFWSMDIFWYYRFQWGFYEIKTWFSPLVAEKYMEMYTCYFSRQVHISLEVSTCNEDSLINVNVLQNNFPWQWQSNITNTLSNGIIPKTKSRSM